MSMVGRFISFDNNWGFSRKERVRLTTRYNVEFINVNKFSLKNNPILNKIIENERGRVSELYYRNGNVYEKTKSEFDHPDLRRNELLEGLTRGGNLRQFNILGVFLGKGQLPANRKGENVAPIFHHCIARCKMKPPFYAINAHGNIGKQIMKVLSQYLKVVKNHNEDLRKIDSFDLVGPLKEDMMIQVGKRKVRVYYKGTVLTNKEIRLRIYHIDKLFMKIGTTYSLMRIADP